jgi:hypothetical protein
MLILRRPPVSTFEPIGLIPSEDVAEDVTMPKM